MFRRLLKTTRSHSFFLFGARGTGKTTYIKDSFDLDASLYIDLLDPEIEDAYRRMPQRFENQVRALPDAIKWVLIDEVQRAPRLLDIVHRLIESSEKRFVLTGSSSRKLKRGASNLLAGRAFVYHLHPLTVPELGEFFDLDQALRWGMLPGVYSLSEDEDRQAFLRAYALTYLKEEIASEQVVRRLDPFRYFLEVAAQSNGMIINYAKIAEDVGVDPKTVVAYFTILEDTLVGFLLPAYHRSVRKQQRVSPKFYFSIRASSARWLERCQFQSLRAPTSMAGHSSISSSARSLTCQATSTQTGAFPTCGRRPERKLILSSSAPMRRRCSLKSSRSSAWWREIFVASLVSPRILRIHSPSASAGMRRA